MYISLRFRLPTNVILRDISTGGEHFNRVYHNRISKGVGYVKKDANNLKNCLENFIGVIQLSFGSVTSTAEESNSLTISRCQSFFYMTTTGLLDHCPMPICNR